jgi:predicted DsbA family dithiol-disulfide isomerase
MEPILRIQEFTDPACPFAFSAEPARQRLRWLYGGAIEWRPRMIVLSQSPDEYLDKGFTTEKMAAGLETIQRKYGMPIDPRERPRMSASVHACWAVVAARLHAPQHERQLLRQLRIRAMAGELLDDPITIAHAARDAGLQPLRLFGIWHADPAVDEAMEADMAAARNPSRAALALDHKLAAAGEGRRYTAPSYEIERIDTGARFDVPGFQPAAVYEAAIANLAPELERRAAPESAEEVLAWADEPLATAEVAAVMDVDLDEARTELARVAHEEPVGPDGWWSLPPAEAPGVAAAA